GDVARQAQREMDRLRRLPPGSPEAGQVRAYLQWLWSMPWHRLAPEDVELDDVHPVLEREHLGLPRATERMLEYLGVRRLMPELLDPEANTHFVDHYLGLSVDLSHVVLLMCANVLELVPDTLQERLELLEVPGYGENEKLEIARRFLVPRQLTEHGLTPRDLK